MRTTLIVVICIFFSSALGQDLRQIDTKYGKPIKVYSVSQHVWMTPEYAADGKICRMRLYPKRIAGDINYLSPDLPFEELRNVLNQLVPVNKRGVKREPFGSTATGGPAAWTIYSYQEVTFTFVSAFSSFTTEDSAPLKKGDFVFPKSGTSSGRELGVPVPSDDDFLAVKTSHPEIVAIEWNGRECVEK